MSRPRPAGIAASVILVLIAFTLVLVGGDGEESPVSLERSPRLVSVEELEELEGTLGHSLYWAGERPPSRIEAASEPDGSVYLRYLPSGVPAGDERATFLTVGTYPVPEAQDAVRRAAETAGGTLGRVQAGGIVFTEPESEMSAYLAYPDSDLQIEVYHPVPGRARELIDSGMIQEVGR